MIISRIRKLTSLALLTCAVGLSSPLSAMKQNVLPDILESTSLDYPELLDNKVRAALTLKAGISLLDNKDYKTALQHFTAVTEEENDNKVRAWAYYYLGKMHNLGLSVEPNREKMLFYFSKAKEIATKEDIDEILNIISFHSFGINPLNYFTETFLRNAVKKGHLELFNVLLSANIDLNLFDEHGNTPLITAIHNNQVLIAKKLIAHVGLLATDKKGNSILHIAVKNRNLSMLRMILEENKSTNYFTSCSCNKTLVKDPCRHKQANNFLNKERLDINFLNDSYRPLDIAVEFNQFEMVELLLNAGADHTYQGFQTPLLRACIDGYVDIVKLLLDNGADPNEAREEQDWTCLHAAHENLEIVRLLLSKGANVNADVTDDGGGTPLHHASRYGNTETVKLLLAHGANVTMLDCDENTPLHEAVQNGHTDIVVLLLAAKSPFDTTSYEQQTLLHIASSEGYDEITQILLTMGVSTNKLDTNGYAPLHYASLNGHASIVEKLLQCGASINAAVPEKWTPFHLACSKGHVSVVRLLVSKGAQIHGTPNEFSGLGLAARKGSAETVDFLLKTYKDQVPSHKGTTPLGWAVLSHNNNVIKLLTKHQPTTMKENYDCLLMQAVANGNIFAVQHFISLGANLAAVDAHNRTPLHFAAAGLINIRQSLDQTNDIDPLPCFKETPVVLDDCYIQIITILLQKRKMLLYATDSLKKTPLHWAVGFGSQESVETLLNHGSSIDSLDSDGNSALDIALKRGNKAIIRTLSTIYQRKKN